MRPFSAVIKHVDSLSAVRPSSSLWFQPFHLGLRQPRPRQCFTFFRKSPLPKRGQGHLYLVLSHAAMQRSRGSGQCPAFRALPSVVHRASIVTPFLLSRGFCFPYHQRSMTGMPFVPFYAVTVYVAHDLTLTLHFLLYRSFPPLSARCVSCHLLSRSACETFTRIRLYSHIVSPFSLCTPLTNLQLPGPFRMSAPPIVPAPAGEDVKDFVAHALVKPQHIGDEDPNSHGPEVSPAGSAPGAHNTEHIALVDEDPSTNGPLPPPLHPATRTEVQHVLAAMEVCWCRCLVDPSLRRRPDASAFCFIRRA